MLCNKKNYDYNKLFYSVLPTFIKYGFSIYILIKYRFKLMNVRPYHIIAHIFLKPKFCAEEGAFLFLLYIFYTMIVTLVVIHSPDRIDL